MTLYPELTALESEIPISNLSLPLALLRPECKGASRSLKRATEVNGMSPTLFVA